MSAAWSWVRSALCAMYALNAVRSPANVSGSRRLGGVWLESKAIIMQFVTTVVFEVPADPSTKMPGWGMRRMFTLAGPESSGASPYSARPVVFVLRKSLCRPSPTK